MNCLCLGPKRAGKTHLLKALQDPLSIDDTTYSPPTIGTSIYKIDFESPSVSTSQANTSQPSTSKASQARVSAAPTRKKKNEKKSIQVVEIGGAMAPMWKKYFKDDVTKIIYVIDTSNLCQISCAGVLLYSILVEPMLQKTKFLLVLTKMDYAYRQMRNEALLILQMSKLQKEINQELTIVEVSSVTKEGLEKVREWLQKN